ncbi:UvrABC system protein C [Acrasis kona]|uniref:UvrABC system protein C n=1 Tax=Acrasis kona TaxID=1008807 RepID=A0AAW2ZMG8_9EUKA
MSIHSTDEAVQDIKDFWKDNSEAFTNYWTAILSHDYRAEFISKITIISDFNKKHVGMVEVVAPELYPKIGAQMDGFALLHLFHHVNTLSETIVKDYGMFLSLKRNGFFDKPSYQRFISQHNKDDYVDTTTNQIIRITDPTKEQLEQMEKQTLLDANLYRLCEIRQYLIVAFLSAVIENYERSKDEKIEKDK